MPNSYFKIRISYFKIRNSYFKIRFWHENLQLEMWHAIFLNPIGYLPLGLFLNTNLGRPVVVSFFFHSGKHCCLAKYIVTNLSGRLANFLGAHSGPSCSVGPEDPAVTTLVEHFKKVITEIADKWSHWPSKWISKKINKICM